jgi:hypothetical protein
MRFRQLVPSINEVRPNVNGERVRMLSLPPLVEAREEFKRTTGLDFEFEDTE